MGKIRKDKVIKSNIRPNSENLESDISKPVLTKKNKSGVHLGKVSCKKKDIAITIRNEHRYISHLFELLDLAKLSQGRRNESEEDDDSESMQLADVPEQKMFKKHTQKKGTSQQASLKNKSFPQTIEGLQKELEELKGTPMTYQKKLRKKGLQTRLVKKKRKDLLRLKKAASKSGKKHLTNVNGFSKAKLILNSDGNVVSNKFDFADTDIKKENKRKSSNTNSDTSSNHTANVSNGNFNKNEHSRDNHKSNSSTSSEFNKSPVKQEAAGQPAAPQGPIFNKDNKMVFSKVYLPENNKKLMKKTNKDPKKILKKLKEDNKKINKLEKEDHEKATSLKEKQKWAAALKRASGEKVKDDPELLRKSIAREKNQKVRSQKKWKARLDNIEKEKEEKQKKRKDNLQTRKNEKKKKKIKKAIKKGSYVPL